jgi:hypothetical protein
MASVAPVSRVSCGVPVTLTTSEKTTWTETVPPIPRVPFGVEEVTLVTVGAQPPDVSTTRALLAPRDHAAHGAGRVRVASTRPVFFIVHQLRSRDVVET